MPRPVPNSLFLMDLARRVQKTQKQALSYPVLLTAQPGYNKAIIAGQGEKALHVFDLDSGQITGELPMPEGTRHPTDFRIHSFSPDHRHFCSYNKWEKSFAIWELATGKLTNWHKGFGMLPPAMAFLPQGEVVLSDGPRINFYEIGGALKRYTALSEDVRSMVFFPVMKKSAFLTVVGVFRKGKSGHSINCFHVQEGRVVAAAEGPYRQRGNGPNTDRAITLHEMLRIPGMTDEILVILEEETLSSYDPIASGTIADRYSTRLIAVNPSLCKFYTDEILLDGRFCIENTSNELHVVDELGRHRRVTGFPLKAEPIDWRLMT